MENLNPSVIVRKFEESQMAQPDKKLYKAGFQNAIGVPTEAGLLATKAIWSKIKVELVKMIDLAEKEIKEDQED